MRVSASDEGNPTMRSHARSRKAVPDQTMLWPEEEKCESAVPEELPAPSPEPPQTPEAVLVALLEEISLPDAVSITPAATTVLVPEPEAIVLPDGVRLIRYEPAEAPVRLSECAVVVDAAGFIRTALRELDHELHGNHWLSGHWGRQGLIGRLKAVGVEIEIDDPEDGGAKRP
jgi:hypothetical protein